MIVIVRKEYRWLIMSKSDLWSMLVVFGQSQGHVVLININPLEKQRVQLDSH